ncbi:hypothetical protein BS78_10G039700 [Paspalum vaginatum]|nr:hypothetical protein BS78_10G039700 [Paspalum vaginatum]
MAPARAWLEDVATKQREWLQQAENYISKASLLADKLNIDAAPLLPGNKAWSKGATIPVSVALGRILHDLPAAGSCGADRGELEEVEAALRDMEFIDADGKMARLPRPGGELAGLPRPVSPTHCARSLLQMARHWSCLVPLRYRIHSFEPAQEAEPGTGPLKSASPTQEIDHFFTTPSMPLLHQAPPPHQQRRRKTYDLANVCRSACLANRPAMPAMRRAQINLCHRLGLPAVEEDHCSMEQVLKDYIAMYDTSLPEYAIAALSNLLCVDDEYMEQLDETLVGLVGQGIEGFLDAEGAPAEGIAVEE